MRKTAQKLKISLKAKIIFLLLPVVMLLIAEFVARIFIPFYNSNNIVSKAPILKEAFNEQPGKIDEETLMNNYKLTMHGKMLMLPFHQPERDCLYKLKPNTSFSFRIPGSYIVNYKTDSLGFRDYEFTLKKPDNTIRIVCAGDSSTFGFFVNIFDTYPKRLERLLQCCTDQKNAQVINAGTFAYTSYLGLLSTKKYILKLQPDILIASYGYNDSFKTLFRDGETQSRTFWHKLQQGFNKFALYKAIEKFSIKIKGVKPVKLYDTPRVDMDSYRDNLEKLNQICKENGIHLILIPISAPVDYVNVAKDVANRTGCGFIDIEAVFQAYQKTFLKTGVDSYKGIKFPVLQKFSYDPYHEQRFGSKEMCLIRQYNLLFLDYCHPTPIGYQIIAEQLFDYLTDHHFFSKSIDDKDISFPGIRDNKNKNAIIISDDKIKQPLKQLPVIH
jgi:lysophospholipase L1-like esterase